MRQKNVRKDVVLKNIINIMPLSKSTVICSEFRICKNIMAHNFTLIIGTNSGRRREIWGFLWWIQERCLYLPRKYLEIHSLELYEKGFAYNDGAGAADGGKCTSASR